MIANEAAIEWDLNNAQESYLGSALMLGMFLGSIALSYPPDRYGRMPFFKSSQLAAGGIGILCCFSYNLWMACACFLIIGFVIGGDFGLVGIVYLESSPPSKRKHLATLSVFMRFGLVLLPAFT
eukprot:CAMPEP_0204908702 /NCGR_PEP_ID=MMETSP1397-20131031/7608_1 /ASSEMBLY_ACC=CAM_ASM_000891 /TAXON_ID=49980 /ORGANISM="Climacostomum Climacostomum virens, Strain Stock W-24" /LENGTH=123 /DNA_ID=CAMNT_0052078321 /DNA_START=565 /DNA_END=932 /DNA_ORIENTATION=-